MKKLSIVFFVSLIFAFTGCEISEEVDLQKDQVSVANYSGYLNAIDTDGKITQVPMTSPRSQSSLGINARKSEGTVKVSGHMEFFPNESDFSYKKSFNAIGTATDGKGQVESSFTNWGTVHGSVLCAYSMGNEAVVAMYIDRPKETLEEVYDEGRIVWFRVIDNGEGANDPKDQFYGRHYYSLDQFETIEDAQDHLINNEVSCQDFFDIYEWINPTDIKEGNIQVKGDSWTEEE